MTTENAAAGDLQRSLELLWNGREETARGPRPALTLDAIVEAGVALADREGIAALGMRRVATELDVGTMTLYRYVPGKAELLDLMLDRVARPSEELVAAGRAGNGWRAVLEAFGWWSWRVFEQHPWLLQVNASRSLLGPNTLASMEVAMSGLGELGLTGRERVGMVLSVAHVVDGAARTYVLHRQTVADSGVYDEEFWAAHGPVLERAMASGRYPHLADLGEQAWDLDAETAVAMGLAAVLDGLERFVGSRSG